MFGFVIFLFLVVCIVFGGCSNSNTIENTSIGKHRMQELWGMKRYHITQEYNKELATAGKVYKNRLANSDMIRVYGFYTVLEIARSERYQARQDAFVKYQNRLKALDGLILEHVRKVYYLKN